MKRDLELLLPAPRAEDMELAKTVACSSPLILSVLLRPRLASAVRAAQVFVSSGYGAIADHGDTSVLVPGRSDELEPLRCANRGREPRPDENAEDEWRAASNELGELLVFCPPCRAGVTGGGLYRPPARGSDRLA
jgi:hypothetical protein